jgi:hypothetical protein
VWSATVDGRRLTFRLSGINNQNFLMRDEETGTWWQQVSGEAIRGPLAGRRLDAVLHDELTFATWRAERAEGRVLRPDESAPWRAFTENWEEGTAKMPVVVATSPGDPLTPREVVVGVVRDGKARAYPLETIRRDAPILDTVGSTPVAVLLAGDGRSVRVFEARIDGATVELFAKTGEGPLRLVDAETGSEWDFTGRAISGPRAGARLVQLPALTDYWFDWKLYHPETTVYGARGGQ